LIKQKSRFLSESGFFVFERLSFIVRLTYIASKPITKLVKTKGRVTQNHSGKKIKKPIQAKVEMKKTNQAILVLFVVDELLILKCF